MLIRALCLGVSIDLCACGPKLIRQEVFRNDFVRVEIRHTEAQGEVVPRGHRHPFVIADVRLAHVLASFSHATGEGVPSPTIRSEHVYDLAEGLSQAFERAGPDDEVVAAAQARDRRLSIFTEERVTSFRAFLEGDLLVFEFFAIEELVPRDHDRSVADDGGYEIPHELSSSRPSFRLVAGEAQTRRGARGIGVDWRDPYYRKPVSLRARYGQLRRRTILMEISEQELEDLSVATPPPEELSDAQLRALDELGAARRAGYVTEAEYRRRHRLVIADRLEEAGYLRDAP